MPSTNFEWHGKITEPCITEDSHEYNNWCLCKLLVLSDLTHLVYKEIMKSLICFVFSCQNQYAVRLGWRTLAEEKVGSTCTITLYVSRLLATPLSIVCLVAVPPPIPPQTIQRRRISSCFSGLNSKSLITLYYSVKARWTWMDLKLIVSNHNEVLMKAETCAWKGCFFWSSFSTILFEPNQNKFCFSPPYKQGEVRREEGGKETVVIHL